MHQPLTNLPIIKPQMIDKNFVCQQILELVDMARNQCDVTVALEGMAMIAQIQGMFDDNDCG